MKLLVMRHGEAVMSFANDHDRPLTALGQHQSTAVGEFLLRENVIPDVIAHSPLVRATATAALVNQKLGIKNVQVWPELNPISSVISAEQRISHATADTLLVVSHMPLVASLQLYLVEANYASADGFMTAELAVLSSPAAYPGNWTLMQRKLI